MRWSRTLQVVSAHAGGEVGRVITSGVLDVPGRTMADKMAHLDADQTLCRFILAEPRGAAQMSANLLLPPTRPEADAGFIVLQTDGPHAMSGSNAMCVTTVLLETGIVPMVEPETVVVLDTPMGLVRARAACRDGRCERVTLDFPPSFVLHLDHPLDVPGLGRIAIDVAYGGSCYGLVDMGVLPDLAIRPMDARALVEIGNRIQDAAEAQIEVGHAAVPHLRRVESIMFCARDAGGYRNATVLYPGRLDRSPCGTGTAARLAAMHAKGLVETGAGPTFRSVIDSRFEAEIAGTTMLGDRPAILPRISGRAWIYGIEQLGLDPSDPYPAGFRLTDTWGPAADG